MVYLKMLLLVYNMRTTLSKLKFQQEAKDKTNMPSKHQKSLITPVYYFERMTYALLRQTLSLKSHRPAFRYSQMTQLQYYFVVAIK